MGDLTAKEVDWAVGFLKGRLTPACRKRLGGDKFAERLLEHLRTRTEPRFVAPAERFGGIQALAREHDPEEFAWETEIADEAVDGKIYAASNAYCRRFIRPDPETFDFSALDHPDPESIHGANRHRWFASLARAYWTDGDARYFDALMDHWDFFNARVPPPTAEHYARVHNLGGPTMQPPYGELDVSIRLTFWWWAYWIILHAPEMTPERNAVLLARALAQFDVRAARGVRVLEHNFTSMMMEGLYLWALMLPEFQGMAVWRHTARTTLEASLGAAVLPDGVQWERSAGYHAGCIRWYGTPFVIGCMNGEAWPAAYTERLRQMGEFLDAVILPDGTMPLISDSDRSRQWLAAASLCRAAFPEMRFRTPVPAAYYSVWLSGGRAWDASETVAEKPRTAVFAESGFAIARSTQSERASMLILDNGPTRAGHAHKNNLTVHYEALGMPVLIDPGRAVYRKDFARAWVTDMRSHNTVFPGDVPVEPNEPLPPPPAHVIAMPGDARVGPTTVEEREGCFELHTRFAGFTVPGAAVRRRVVMSADDARPWLLVVDDIDAPEACTWTNSWLFAASEPVTVDAACATVRTDAGLSIGMAWASDEPLDARDDAMFWFPQYATRSPARWLRLSGRLRSGRRAFVFAPREGGALVPAARFDGDAVRIEVVGEVFIF